MTGGRYSLFGYVLARCYTSTHFRFACFVYLYPSHGFSKFAPASKVVHSMGSCRACGNSSPFLFFSFLAMNFRLATTVVSCATIRIYILVLRKYIFRFLSFQAFVLPL